jgi:D-alanyl-D-alanine carboxypeptidase (penicillin-binding protein 5/6)
MKSVNSCKLFPMPSRRFLLASLLFLTVPAFAQGYNSKKAAPAVPPHQSSAVASFVLDLDSSRVLDAKNPHQRMFPASTTKIMTALVACERMDLNKVIRAGANASNTGESGIGLLEGENHTLAELLQAALVHSANDACVDIAEGVAGSVPEFVKLMNQKAKELGCRDTHFANPHGLHDPNHYTTAHDLAVIGRAALKIPFIDRVARAKTAIISGNWKIGPRRVMINRNKLLFRWDNCDGLKTGYTRQAGNCLVATATQTNPTTGKPWRLLAVALKSRPGQTWPDCETMLKRAFNSYRPQTVVKRDEILQQTNIKGGAFALEASSLRDIALPLRANESQTLSHRVSLFDLTAPVAKGRIVGQVEYFVGQGGAKKRVAAVSLTARDDVPQTLLARAIPPLGNRFRSFPPALRVLLLGLFCLGAASLLLFKRKNHVRRRPHTVFQPGQLESRNAPRGDVRRSAAQRSDSRGTDSRRSEPSRVAGSVRPRPRN